MAIVALSVLAVLHAARFLEAPASAPSPADLLLALGGETGDRVLTAASLFRDGFAPRMLVVARGSWLVGSGSGFGDQITWYAVRGSIDAVVR
jgi:hypothetical protein